MTQTGRFISEVEAVIEFLRKNGLKESESALKEDMIEKTELGSFNFEKFLFELPPVRIQASLRLRDFDVGIGGEGSKGDSKSSSDDEFVSLGSSTSDVCSSEFINPYGLRSASQANSESSSERLSQFGTARDYPDFDMQMQNDLFWCDDKDDNCFMTPSFQGAGYYCSPSEDKFVTSSETKRQYGSPENTYRRHEGFVETSTDYFENPCLLNNALEEESEAQAKDYISCKIEDLQRGIEEDKGSVSLCKCHSGGCQIYFKDPVDNIYSSSKQSDFDDFQLKHKDLCAYWNIDPKHEENKKTDYSSEKIFNSDSIEGFKNLSEFIPNVLDHEVGDGREIYGEVEEARAPAFGEVDDDELLIYSKPEDEYEVFNLRIIHRKNRTGFEETRDIPIVLNSVIAGRYYVIEYLGSAAFSKVVQAHDLHTGVDVCLKIIKNNKDYFDQSLDEIKLLKFVSKNDPTDECHILRLYDYFYHQGHLFIVCELLKANLYEFQKFNQESGDEAYFTLSRLQIITRQCLEALEYLHGLGIIHCDLKPENILIKSYKRCEVKVIDLGSSCFKSDSLCLYVQSRSYRAPEVMLGLPYDERIDIWSLGCILVELCSGEVLFPNDAIVMILARIIGIFGPIDLDMLEKGQETHKYFTKKHDLYHMTEETNQLEYIIPEKCSLQHHLQISDVGFINFVRSMLEVNPLVRPTAREALKHPWLLRSYGSR